MNIKPTRRNGYRRPCEQNKFLPLRNRSLL